MAKPKANTERVNVFFSEDVLNRIKEEAEKKGMTVSGYVRYVVLEHLNLLRQK